jgi:hypothetical protein
VCGTESMVNSGLEVLQKVTVLLVSVSVSVCN